MKWPCEFPFRATPSSQKKRTVIGGFENETKAARSSKEPSVDESDAANDHTVVNHRVDHMCSHNETHSNA